MQKPALYTAAVIFAIVSLAHLVRFLLGSEILIDGHAVPVSFSLIAAVVVAGLAAWMAREARRS